jgi:hypothetical protein
MFESCGGCCLSLVLIPLLCLGLVACALIYLVTLDVDTPLPGNFQPSYAEAQAFSTAIDNAVARAQGGGGWELSFTEQQISSWMALEGEAFADEHGHAFPFTNVQVGLNDGAMTFYAELETRLTGVPLQVIIRPKVAPDGQLDFDIAEVKVADIGAPDFVVQTVKAQFEEALARPLEDLPGNYFIYPQSLVVDNGVFRVQGAIVR